MKATVLFGFLLMIIIYYLAHFFYHFFYPHISQQLGDGNTWLSRTVSWFLAFVVVMGVIAWPVNYLYKKIEDWDVE